MSLFSVAQSRNDCTHLSEDQRENFSIFPFLPEKKCVKLFPLILTWKKIREKKNEKLEKKYRENQNRGK